MKNRRDALCEHCIYFIFDFLSRRYECVLLYGIVVNPAL